MLTLAKIIIDVLLSVFL